MKRKKTVGETAPEGKTPEAQARVLEERPFSPWDAVQVCLFAVLLFLAMTVQTAWMSVALPVLALALSIGRGPLRRLRERFCVPALGFVLFAVVCGFSAVGAPFGAYAVREFYKFMASSALAVIVLVRFDKKHVRGLLWGVAAACGVIGLMCVDAASDGALFRLFDGLMESLGTTYREVNQNSWNNRLVGIYNDGNISASILALGALAGLHLTLTGAKRWERALACLLTGWNGLSFFLAMSRGGILCFGLALLVYLAAVGKQPRARLFLLMAAHTAATGLLSVPAAAGLSRGAAWPVLLALACGLPVWLLYEFPGLWAAGRLEGHGRALAAAAAALVLAAGIYGAVGFRVTGAYTFGSNGLLYRAVEARPGEYTMTADYDGTVHVRVALIPEEGESRNLYWDNSIEDCVFTVDEPGSLGIYFWGEPGEEIRSASLSDGTEIPMNYPLLPDFLVNRMQGDLFSSSSFVDRVQYVRDGWKLFTRAPLLGRGLGCTEGLLTSVQPYFYESLYLHNHVLQVMDESGLLGAAPFLALLLGSAWLLLRRLRESRREGGDALAAALLGCWVMMNAHGLMEINFSIRAYQCAAYVLLLLPVVLYGRPLWEGKADQDGEKASAGRKKLARWSGLAAAVCLWAYLGGFAAALESHRVVEREMWTFSTSSASEFMETTQNWIRRDLFDREQNQLNYVGNAVLLDDTRYNGNMLRYVKALRASGTYTACTGLAEYYYLPRGEWEEVFACSREAVAQEASTHDAWNQQAEFYRDTLLPQVTEEDAAVYLEGVAALADYLESYSQGRQEEIELTEENAAFLERAVKARDSGLEGMAALMYLTIPQG